MTARFALAALSAALLSHTAMAQVAKSAPVQQQLANATPLPADSAWPGGTIGLEIDASDTRRALYRVVETIPVAPGTATLTLLFPEWLPGNHAPRGPISLVSGFRFTADGKPVSWKRNPLDVYQIDLALPPGTKVVKAEFVHTSPISSAEGRITMTQEMLNLQWEKMSFYPAAYYTRRIMVKPTVKFPTGWQVFAALDGQKVAGDRVIWDAVDYETLVDSPIFAGKYAQSFRIGPLEKLDVVADKPAQLAIKPENLKAFSNLVTEAQALFGAKHYDHYDSLLALTERMGSIGLEHHRSSENQYEPEDLTKWDEMDWDRNVVSHEFVHSWNGKYRRPADLWTPDYRTPMQGSLLWVYEGQTQFWGYILAARSGVQKKETVLGALASNAATYSEGQPGREFRSVADTTNDPIVNARRPTPFGSLTRSEDYYSEGALVWLEADQIIRKGTGGAKGLDDFARAFFGMRDGDWGELTYDFDEVARTLNGVYPYDWTKFLDTRLRQAGQPAPLNGIAMAGYKLVWKDAPNPYDKGRFADAKSNNLTYSLGMVLDKDGKVTGALWDGPAFNAGIVSGAQVVAVNGEAYTKEGLTDAIKAAANTTQPIQLLVKRGDRFDTVPIDYHKGLRYPWLEPAGPGEQGLDRLLAPRIGK